MTRDERWMRRALRLAARGQTPPNPMVGCVVVRGEEAIGEGYHPYAGAPHAEVFALQAAGDRARGATAYVTLEPCAHFGRTPPCSRALIGAGVARVVAATVDPDPRVSGQGIAELRAAGIQVDVGVLEAEALALNVAFFHFQRTGLPYVVLKAAMTLDGKIATHTGDSRWVTGEAARRHVHRLRARMGAVLCGVGTVLADDPMLTARIPGALRQPVRVVLDSRLRTPESARLVATAREAPTLIATTQAASDERVARLSERGVEVVRLPAGADARVDVAALFEELGRRGVTSVLVEGGAEVHAACLSNRQAHRVLWFVAPKMVGGRSAPGPVGDPGVERMESALAITNTRLRRFGEDILVEGEPAYR